MTKFYVLLALLSALAFPLVVFAHDGDIKTENYHTKFKFIKPRVHLRFLLPPPPPRAHTHTPAPAPAPAPSPQPSPPPSQNYVPPQVAVLYPNDRIAVAGDSLTYLGFLSGGWVADWQQYLQTYHAAMNVQFFNYGIGGNNSSELLNRFPAVLQSNPTVVMIFIGINDAGYGPSYLPTQFQNIKSMIEQSRACPSVRTVVLVSPFCFGEQYDGENPYDGTIDEMTNSQANLASVTNCPFINLRALWSSAEHIYNQGNASSGILTEGPPGIHPNALGAQIISGGMIKSFGE